MSREVRRRAFLQFGAGVIASGTAGCSIWNPKADNDTPALDPTATTPTPRQMHPIDAGRGPKWDHLKPIERQVYEQVNEARTTRDLDPYAWDPDLAYIGRAHSKDMAERDYFSHNNPEGEGPSGRMMAYGLGDTYFSATENIIRFPIPEEATKDAVADRIFRAWKKSDPHWDAILSTDHERAGVGVYITEERTLYGTMVFGILDDPDP
jgi:uncharacterized protein YkwD